MDGDRFRVFNMDNVKEYSANADTVLNECMVRAQEKWGGMLYPWVFVSAVVWFPLLVLNLLVAFVACMLGKNGAATKFDIFILVITYGVVLGSIGESKKYIKKIDFTKK